MIIDVVYVAWNRYEFTRFSFGHLLANTSWDLVRTLHVYDNGSIDGTRELLLDLIHTCPHDIDIVFHDGVCNSPVEVMNHYLEWQGVPPGGDPSEYFAKVDNDIILPAGWLDILLHVIMRDKQDVLGVESGRISVPQDIPVNKYESEHARWIGGVGLLRTEAIATKPRMVVNGRFGWTEFQREYRNLRIAWLSPDLALSELTRIPFEPWVSLSDEYRQVEFDEGERKLEREWPRYHETWGEPYWGWWRDAEHVVPDPDRERRIEKWGR